MQIGNTIELGTDLNCIRYQKEKNASQTMQRGVKGPEKMFNISSCNMYKKKGN